VHKIVAGGLLVFFALVTVNWGMAKNALYIASLAAIISLIVNRQSSVKLDRSEWLLFAVLFLFIVHSLISLWVNDFPEYGYLHIRSRLSKFLFLIPLYLFFRKHGFPYGLFLFIVSTGAIIGGIDALVDFAGNGFSFWKRVKGGGDRVFYYTIIMGAYLVILCSAIPRAFKQSKISGLLLLIPSAFALSGIVISGTRGVWLAVVAAVFILLVAKRKELGLKGAAIAIGVLFILAASLWQVDYIQIRIKSVQRDFVSYFENGSKQGSVGPRFELWKIAATLGVENPVFGVGPAGFADTIKEEHQERNWNKTLYIFEYPHNQYLAIFAALGVPGLILHLLLLILPVWMFLRGWHNLGPELRRIALAGGLVIVIFAVSGLTYDHLLGRMQISVYAALTGVLLGLVKYHLLQQSSKLLVPESNQS
jgi:O-antigen ligase